MARQVDFEYPNVCNACTWHSPYLVHKAPTNGSLSVGLPPLVGYPRHACSRFTCRHRFHTIRDVRAWMLNAAGITLDDLYASIESACMIQRLDTHRIWCNRHPRGMNPFRSAYPFLLVTSGISLADSHVSIDSAWFEMCVHGC